VIVLITVVDFHKPAITIFINILLERKLWRLHYRMSLSVGGEHRADKLIDSGDLVAELVPAILS
jgi:hypothetical protein